jgi:beta-galactosidase
LADGIGGRYQSIYLPAFISLSDELLDMLISYVEDGGRVILDMPSSYLDGYGRVLYTHEGTRFEKLFGTVLNEYGYAREINNAWTIGDIPLEGFTAVMTPTSATVLASYSDQGGAAITENSLGKGTAVILGAEASLGCHKPGNEAMETLIRDLCVNGSPLPYACEGALAYRLVAPGASHYFLINDGPAKEVVLRLNDSAGTCTDALTGEAVDLSRPVSVEREGGRWLRVETAS